MNGPPLGEGRLFAKDLASRFRISARSARRWLLELEGLPDGHKLVGRVGTGLLKAQRFTTLAALAKVQPLGGPTHRELSDRVSCLDDEIRQARVAIAELVSRIVRLER